MGRAIVVATTLYCAVDWIVFAERGEVHRLVSLFASPLLATGAYMAVHWALQPEYLFPQWVFWSVSWDPFTRRFGRLRAKRAALPLTQWLNGLLECCKNVADGKYLQNTEELQAEVLIRLESRACLTQHRQLLTRDSFRVLRRFIQSVDALDHHAANELRLQAVKNSAKTVLELRDRRGILLEDPASRP